MFVFSGLCVSYGQDIVTVSAETASIRSSPNAKASVIKTAKQGESFPLIAQQGAWNKVKVGKNFGWIHGNSLESALPLLRTTERPYGDTNSRFEVFADGTGTGTGTGRGTGTGVAIGQGSGSTGARTALPNEPARSVPTSDTTALRILSKPRAEYTEVARRNQIQGTVRLRVVFLSTGEIGDQAINAARGIRFEPMRVKGEPRSTTKVIEYGFAIY